MMAAESARASDSNHSDIPSVDDSRQAEFSDLLRCARGGDTEALGRLLQWYANYLNIMASTQLDFRLRRRVNPSDIVQEAMLAAHRDFEGFRGHTQSELIAWLRTILIHTLHRNYDKHVKVAKRDIRREVSIDEISRRMDESVDDLAGLLPGRNDSPSAPLLCRERDVEFAGLLRDLRPPHRDVILYRILKGLSFDEIAVLMNRSEGAVRMLWFRALEAFKTQGESVHDAC